MKKKLTLRMEKDIIERAKAYAAERGESVSKLVENYFAALTALEREEERDTDWREQLPPITRSLVGCLRGSEVDEEDYHRYLEEKYLGKEAS